MHGWQFDHSGQCVEVPCTSVHSAQHLDTWQVQEKDGGLWLWWPPHANPDWDPPSIPEHADPEWTRLTNTNNRWVVRTIPQMIQENAADIHHLQQLHGFAEPRFTDFGPRGSVFVSNFTHLRHYEEAGITEPVTVSTEIEIFALGASKQNSVAAETIESTTVCTTTPVDSNHVDLRMTSAVKRNFDHTTTQDILDIVLDTTKTTVEEDLPLWESRDYSVRNFHSGDKSIASFQQWAKQFYVGD
ncbi:MAG: hypothetical protein WB565_17980 [Acidimicrobiales bacterium]